jgi:hypothetical protein
MLLAFAIPFVLIVFDRNCIRFFKKPHESDAVFVDPVEQLKNLSNESKDNEPEKREEICIICLESFCDNPNLEQIECLCSKSKHSDGICFGCLMELWNRKKFECPMCRGPLNFVAVQTNIVFGKFKESVPKDELSSTKIRVKYQSGLLRFIDEGKAKQIKFCTAYIRYFNEVLQINNDFYPKEKIIELKLNFSVRKSFFDDKLYPKTNLYYLKYCQLYECEYSTSFDPNDPRYES